MKNYLNLICLSLTISFFSFLEIKAIENDTDANINDKSKKDSIGSVANGAADYTSDDKKLVEIKDNLTFDPIQKRWVPVKQVVGVEKADKKVENDGDAKLYENAMVYDKNSKKWSRTNIDNHLYDEINVNKEEPGFLNNFSIGMTIGAGATFYKNNLNGLAILNYKDKLYFQSLKQKVDGGATQVGWFHDKYGMNDYFDNNGATIMSDINDKGNFYTGSGWSFPISLFFDYKFFDLLRIGLLFAMEFTRLSILAPSDEIKDKVKPIDDVSGNSTFLFNIRPLLLVGYKIYSMENSDFFVNLGLGPVFDKGIGRKEVNGSYSKNLLSFNGTRLGTFVSIGPSCEFKLNGYCTMISQISYDFKYYSDRLLSEGKTIFGDKDAYVSLWQNSIKVELGMRFTFAEN